MGKEVEGDVPIPCPPAAHLILIESDLSFGPLQGALNRPVPSPPLLPTRLLIPRSQCRRVLPDACSCQVVRQVTSLLRHIAHFTGSLGIDKITMSLDRSSCGPVSTILLPSRRQNSALPYHETTIHTSELREETDHRDSLG